MYNKTFRKDEILMIQSLKLIFETSFQSVRWQQPATLTTRIAQALRNRMSSLETKARAISQSLNGQEYFPSVEHPALEHAGS